MKHKLVSIALIAVLLCTVLGNSIACTTTTTYTLTITSTAGGDVTAPVEGTHTYDEGTVVNLVATADADYHFVKWTGNVGTIADDEDATTTITMNGNYAITANFGFDMAFIDEVPDTNQPPTQIVATTVFIANYCAPMAMVNVLGYWDVVMGHSNAENLTAFQQPPNLKTVAEYLGYFMDTNNTGSPDRGNGIDGHPGTYDKDIDLGALDFVRWDITHPPAQPPVTPPPFALPGGKLGYDWTITRACIPDPVLSLDFYKTEIDAGRPLVVSFLFWNPVDEDIAVIDPETGETIDVFSWGEPKFYSEDPEEIWYEGEIGHAVTGVGYILNWDPDGSGPLGSDDYVIVHDNWASTPENVAIPWAFWNSSHAVDPGP